ncbi:MAG: tetratricopeptide repeat protein [Candidatus Aegiribacteria sp.]|nr:tetratricopeptide repeat protein [Candidatus Aegiribacteria sp.]
MRNLIPFFIHEQHRNGNSIGCLQVATMFVDIAGFTHMTEAQMQHGDEGLEVLTNILNHLFNPIVDSIASNSGFISTYAGDAFTAVFTKGSESALMSAIEIRAIINKLRVCRTRFGEFTLNARIGLASGKAEWGIIGETRKAFYFRGEPVDECARAEQMIGLDQIGLTGKFLESVEGKAISTERLKDGIYRLVNAGNITVQHIDTPIPRLSKDILSDFLPETIVEYGKEGEFRNVASLFFSFIGINSHHELDVLVSMLSEQSRRYSGFFNKIDFGDKGAMILFLFGAHVAHENNVKRALDFTIAMKHEIEILVKDSPESDVRLKNLNWRIGLTYGKAFTGIVGGDRRCEFTAIGNEVNLAVRMATRTPWSEVWVTDQIYRREKDSYNFEPAGKYIFKGKSNKIPVYRLRGKQISPNRSFSGKFVGRESQLMEAQGFILSSLAGMTGNLLYIYGEAGVGKSRFAAELKRLNPKLNWLYLPCDGILRKAFNPFIFFFMCFFEQSVENNADRNRRNFEDNFQKLIDTAGSSFCNTAEKIRNELIRLKSVMAGFLGIRYEESLYEQLEPKLRYKNVILSIQETIKAMSLNNQIVLEVEDINWIDRDSAEVLDIVYERMKGFPVVFILTGRLLENGSKPRLSVESDFSDIDLRTMSGDEMREIAEGFLQGSLSKPLFDNLLSRTEGNPFFIEQTISYFKEAGIIEKSTESGMWNIVCEDSAIPASISDLMITRIDQLSDQLKEIVQTASVLGMKFERRLLARVFQETCRNPASISGSMLEGVNRNIWIDLDHLTYAFTHATLQDIAYDMQLKARLRLLHQIAAQSVEELYPEDVQYFPDIAFHYERAEIPRKMIKYLKKAADHARETYALDEAKDFYGKALISLSGHSDFETAEIHENQITIHYGLGQIFQMQAMFINAENSYTSMLSTAEAAGDIDAQARALNKLAQIQTSQGNHSSALVIAGRSEELGRCAGLQIEVANALLSKGWADYRLGHTEDAMISAEEALSLSTELDTTHEIARSLNLLGFINDALSQSDKALHYKKRALEMCERSNDHRGIGTMLNNLGVTYGAIGNHQAAEDIYRESLSLGQQIGDRRQIVLCRSNLASTLVNLGRYREAEKELRIVIRELESTNWFAISDTYLFLAEALLGQGKTKEALETVKRALSLTEDIEAPEHYAASWCTLGKIAVRLKEPINIAGKEYDMTACFTRSMQCFTDIGREREQADILRYWAICEQESGNIEKARTLWHQAYETFDRLGLKLETERMLADKRMHQER